MRVRAQQPDWSIGSKKSLDFLHVIYARMTGEGSEPRGCPKAREKLLDLARPQHDRILKRALGAAADGPELASLIEALHSV